MYALANLLRPKVSEQHAGNIWFYDAKSANQSITDCSSVGFFNSITDNNFRAGDLINLNATDGNSIAYVSFDINNNIVITEVEADIPMADETTAGIVMLQNDIIDKTSTNKAVTPRYVIDTLINDNADIISNDRATTPKYVSKAISDALLSPNVLANVFVAVTTNIPLTGPLTYKGIVVPNSSRVLVTGQTDSRANGVYILNTEGPWMRAGDADTIAKLSRAQVTSLNEDAGLYMCTVQPDAVLGTDDIVFVNLYGQAISSIGVRIYNSTVVYNTNDLVVTNVLDGYIWKCLVDSTVNVEPEMSSNSWEIYQGLLFEDSAIVAPNGDDVKSIGFPYKTYMGAISDLDPGSYVEGRAVFNTENITPKANMTICGKSSGINSINIVAFNVTIDGIDVANTQGANDTIVVDSVNTSTFRNMNVNVGAGIRAIYMVGGWDGLHRFSNVEVTGSIVIEGGLSTGIAYFENCIGDLTITVNCTSGAKVYLSNCPNFKVNKIAGSVTRLNTDSFVGDLKYGYTNADHGNWLLLDGRNVSRTLYSELFAVYGTTYGIGDGSTTFGIPNALGKTLHSAGMGYDLGTSLGNANYTLTTNNLPTHTHTIDHTHTAFNTSAGTGHNHTMTHTHSIDHQHPATSVTGSANTSATTTNPASGVLGAPYVRDSDGLKYADGQYDELRFYRSDNAYIQPADMDFLVVAAIAQTVTLPNLSGTSGASSSSTTLLESSHTHPVTVPAFNGVSGNNSTSNNPFSLFQPTMCLGYAFVCTKGNIL